MIHPVILTVTADGSMLPLIVIFKKYHLKLTAPEGVLIIEQTKAWMAEEGVP